jgi:hypothetical protein
MSIAYMRADDARHLMEESNRPARIALHEVIRYAQRKIKLAAQFGREYDCMFAIPLLLPDIPPYQWERMIGDLQRHLEGQGFYCKAVPAQPILYINWQHSVNRGGDKAAAPGRQVSRQQRI